MNETLIEWADLTWNLWSGCQKVSAGCKNCYAEAKAERFRGHGPAFPNGFDYTPRPHRLFEPLTKRAAKRIFVNSMSDVFWDKVPAKMLDQLFAVILANHTLSGWNRRDMMPHHFLILTKRAEAMAEYFAQGREALLRRWSKACDTDFNLYDGDVTFSEYIAGFGDSIPWPLPRLWLGVSVENQKTLGRLELLKQVDAAVRFVSFEPLLESLGQPDLAGIHWSIIGGESGAGSRLMTLEWVEELIQASRRAQSAVFVKQLGSVWAGSAVRKGGDMDEWPEHLRVREFPEVARG